MHLPESLLTLLRGGAAVATLTLVGCPSEPPSRRPPAPSTEAVSPTPEPVTPPPTPEPVTPPPTPEPVPVEPDVEPEPTIPEHDPNYCPPCGRG